MKNFISSSLVSSPLIVSFSFKFSSSCSLESISVWCILSNNKSILFFMSSMSSFFSKLVDLRSSFKSDENGVLVVNESLNSPSEFSYSWIFLPEFRDFLEELAHCWASSFISFNVFFISRVKSLFFLIVGSGKIEVDIEY